MMWAEKLGKQLGNPTQSIAGWLVSKLFKVRNKVLEENAVQLCGIQPGDTVLELGHGPGLGLESAVKLLTGPTGHLIGVDYSEYMHQMAKERMKDFLATGKVTLHLCDVAAMPVAVSSVDKVFHCNCYYFWPDQKKAALEIHRVMKPGGLMVSTLRLAHVAVLGAKGVMPGENWRPEGYMTVLRDCGFTDVRMEDKQHHDLTFQAIFATASK
uniref:Zgc:194242 n=1 Tax=Oryzias sinensis TaxID=183150 RepID=A0A8C7XMI2_9TELE